MTTARWGFAVFASSYALFLVLETLRPGFVSTSFSVHWLLVVAFVFAAVDAATPDRPARRVGWGSWVVAFLLGSVAGGLAWSFGEAFGDLRLFLALAALMLPMVSLTVYRT